MPKGKRYTDAEVHLIAKAYCWATNDGIKGSEQKLDSFMQRVVEYLKRHAPDNVIEGTYHTRDVGSIQKYINKMKADVAKFMAKLRQVELVDWSGLSYDQKVNIAVAVYLGKAKAPHYDYKNFDATAWPNYRPFQVMSTMPQFRTPKVPPSANASIPGSAEKSSDNSIPSADNESIEDNSSASFNDALPTKRSATSRGGSGIKKAKKDILDGKKEEARLAEIASLNESIKELVSETRKAREEKVKDREMAELCTILDHTENKTDLVNYLENKVRQRLGLPKPIPESVGVANPYDDQSSIGI